MFQGRKFKKDSFKVFLRIFARVFPTDYFACSEKAGIWLFGNKNFKNGNVNVIKNAVDFKRFKVPNTF